MNPEAMRAESTSHGERVVTMTHLIDATPETLWKAWTDPKQFAQWFAPEPLTVPYAEMDVRVGGDYRYAMRDQDGNEFPGSGEYLQVIEPRRLVYTDSVNEMPRDFLDQINEARGEEKGKHVADGTVTITLEEAGSGKTKVTFSEEFDSRATRDAWVQMQMVEGLHQTLGNLEKFVAKTPTMAR